MEEFAIITDSTAYIPQYLIDQYQIQVAPQVLIWGETSYLDGVDIQPEEFYERLQQSDIHPTTSQATVASFHSMYEPLVEKDIPILTIVLSAELSGTLQSAQQAKAMFPGARFPIIIGTRNGLTRRGPFSVKTEKLRSKVWTPPMPLPT